MYLLIIAALVAYRHHSSMLQTPAILYELKYSQHRGQLSQGIFFFGNRDQHGFVISLCPWERHFTALLLGGLSKQFKILPIALNIKN